MIPKTLKRFRMILNLLALVVAVGVSTTQRDLCLPIFLGCTEGCVN